MAGESSGNERDLHQTPTWVIAGVSAVMIILSIALEMAFHKIGTWLNKRQKRGLYEAVDKVKAELMVMGFISLLLTISQDFIVKICIPLNVANTMLPCKIDSSVEQQHRRLLWNNRRILAGGTVAKCKPGKVPLITVDGAHQLHILIFFLAVLHVLYSAITMTLGKLKIRRWKKWEHETLSLNFQPTNDPSKMRLSHETTFVKAHSSFWTRLPIFFYLGCFFRQFLISVHKTDYLTLRNGFITAHLAPGSYFNFQKYIKRSLEDDFKVVVGVSPVLWASFVIFLLLNVSGWRTLFWASLLPLIIIVAIGTKLQAILTKMAVEITDRHAVVVGMPLVQGSDKYFWFSKPDLLLHLIHFALFQNAFQISFFLWTLYKFGKDSCFHESVELVTTKIIIGIGVLTLCSYSTLPLYALVAQMGSHTKKSIFDEQTAKDVKKWHMDVKTNLGESNVRHSSPIITLGGTSKGSKNKPLRQNSFVPTLRRFMTTGHSASLSTYDHTHEDDQTLLVDDKNRESEMMALPPLEETMNEDHDHHSIV